MKRLLTLKAWKLLVAVVVVPFFLFFILQIALVLATYWQGKNVPVFYGLDMGMAYTFVWFFLVLSLPFVWQYQVGTKLSKKLANGRTYFDRKFRFAFFVPATILIVLILTTIIQETDTSGVSVSESRVQGTLFFFFLVVYLIGFFFRYRQMGQTLHWVDVASNRQPRGNTVNLLLTLFWWIGIWFLQPRIRAAWLGLQERTMEDHFIEE